MEESTNKNKVLFIGLILFLLAILLGGYFYFTYTKDNNEALQIFYDDAVALSKEYGKEDAAIEAFRESLALSTDLDTSARINRQIAKLLFIRNNGDDRFESIQLFKSIIDDTRISNSRRASALNTLASLLLDFGIDEETGRLSLFNSEPYKSFYAKSSGMAETTLEIFKYADSTYPTAQSKYNIAYILAVDIYTERSTIGIPEKEQAQQVQKYLADAEVLLERGDDNYIYTNADRAYMLTQKAVILGVTENVLNNISENEMELAFQEAIEAADLESSNRFNATLPVYVRFNYAVHLISRYGDKRGEDILPLLTFISNVNGAHHESFYDYVRSIPTLPTENILRRSTTKLADTSPEFETYLNQHGWKR